MVAFGKILLVIPISTVSQQLCLTLYFSAGPKGSCTKTVSLRDRDLPPPPARFIVFDETFANFSQRFLGEVPIFLKPFA
jgi:hypothetical protein